MRDPSAFSATLGTESGASLTPRGSSTVRRIARAVGTATAGRCRDAIDTVTATANAAPRMKARFHERRDRRGRSTGSAGRGPPIAGAGVASADAGGGVPALALTAYASGEDAKRALAAGFQAHAAKPIALLARKRTAVLPDIPTAQEQGLADFEVLSWNALFLPKGTPEPIVRRLNAAMSQALDTPWVRERLEKLGLEVPEPAQRTPEYLAAFLESEIKRWAAPIKASGVSVE